MSRPKRELRKRFDVKIADTLCNMENTDVKGTNINEFFEVIDW